MVSLTDLVLVFEFSDIKKFPGGGGSSPRFPAVPAVVRGRRHILSALTVFSDHLRIIFAPRSIHNVAAERSRLGDSRRYRGRASSRIVLWGSLLYFGRYCRVLAPGWGRGRLWCHEHVSDRSGRENHVQMIGKHSQNAQNVSTTSHERGNYREPRGTAPTIWELFYITKIKYK